ncbi:hypothetical protein DSL72_000350 [Monilinia vaccinii-corymbosi]|uniref:Uncharacterized protein n=1 Tax=Monilinia vaccinii-corymbosi TaxID=61207 RepID=A0A8A3P1D9_9HELO|nr:hypothetical protein DSL72_000350 [Monilinia vaccinii-corymbosi]
MPILPTERTHHRRKLTYDSDGQIRSNGHAFVQDLNYFLTHRMRPALFWKAQCLFRGLPTSGTVDQVMERLRVDGHKPMVPALIDLEEEMRADYERRKLVAEHEADLMMKELADVERARREAPQFTREELPTTHGGQVDGGLESSQNNQDRTQTNVDEDVGNAHSQILRAAKGKDWDVTGDWHVSCPKLEKDLDGPVTLKIFNKQANGQPRMFAKFDFVRRRPRSDVLIFERNVATGKGKAGRAPASMTNRQNHDSFEVKEGDCIDHADLDEERGQGANSSFSSTSEVFFVPVEAKPCPTKNSSPNVPSCAAEAGIFIGLIFGRVFFRVTFHEPYGTRLVGSFGEVYSATSLDGLVSGKEDYDFTGLKFGMSSTPPLGITSIWENQGVAAQRVKNLLQLWASSNI